MRTACLKILVLILLPFFAYSQTTESKFDPLLEAAKKSNTDALIVIEGGKKVVNYYDDSRGDIIESMSVTKSVVALGVARLLTEGKLDSLDTPVGHYYPEWRQGQKKNITVRHLLNNTSGLQNVPNASKEIHPSPDYVQLALSASVVSKPGSEFSYNNKAVNLLSGLIEKISGQKMHKYLEEHLFKQMGITEFHWRKDDAGNPIAMAGLQIKPADLAKLGQLVLQQGSWNNKQLIDPEWVDKLLAQSQPHNNSYGLLWWRVPSKSVHVIDESHLRKLKDQDINKEMIAKLEQLKGEYKSRGELLNSMMSEFGRKGIGELKKEFAGTGLRPWKSTTGSIVGYQAEGYLGQYLVVFPGQDIVAVRMVKNSEDYNRKTDGFEDFSQKLYQLATE